MSGPISAKTLVAGTAGSDDLLRATSDTDGSFLLGRDGDDILRGGRYDDVLVGGEGSDQYFGGAGSDQFRFYGYDVTTGNNDRVYDLNFTTDADVLVFSNFAAGDFTDAAGIDAVNSGAGAIISSVEGLAHFVNDADVVSATRKGATDVLVLHVTYGSETQTIEISNMYSSFVAAGGLIG
jgi:Ca2+-binding RTX toxin-like protein